MADRMLRTLAGAFPSAVKVHFKRQFHRRAIRQAAFRGMVPPRFMWAMVGSPDNFVEQGKEFSCYLIEQGHLTPASHILDIGCGAGKYAMHLVEYQEASGRYEGFDVAPLSVEWCQLAISRRYSFARFLHTPLRSNMYSPGSTEDPSRFRFPYNDSSFDLAFLASVFTHMFAEDVRNYINEIARVLKPGGRCIATVYLLNGRSRQCIAAGTAAFSFSIPRTGCFIELQQPPEAAVAYEERDILDMFSRAGLRVAEPVRYGCWAHQGIQDQDFLVLEKSMP